MLTYSFENIGKQSIYEYLYKCIKQDIIEGKLVAGERLPSKRTLAVNLGISTITVENSYGQLMSEGYIYSLPKKGYYVSDLSGVTKIKPVKYEIPRKKENDEPKYDMDLSSNRTDPDSFPFATWAKLMRRVITDKQEDLMKISPSEGTWELRAAIAMHLASFRDMQVEPEQIIIGAGTEYMYGMLIQLLGRDKTYCVEDPGYSKIARIYSSNNVKYCYAGMDKEGICPDKIRECDADIVHISPTHHFPTGITMPVSRRFELLAWANEKDDRYIIEDDYDSEFRMTGKTIPTMKSIDIGEKVIYMNTFSRTLTPTIRISYMVLPPHLAAVYRERLSFYSCTVSNFEQYTLAEFIQDGYFEKHLNRMRLFYSRQREAVLSVLKSGSCKCVGRVREADSGLHFILELNTKLSDDAVKKQLDSCGIHINALSEYYHDKANSISHQFVISYSNLKIDKFKDAMKKISKL
ncbi:MAG: PLP-dependent aminotransferase family protein [Clostridia bacterium]|nr:PLP-dependent aminotransferase family protein [Clostridia bacterium]